MQLTYELCKETNSFFARPSPKFPSLPLISAIGFGAKSVKMTAQLHYLSHFTPAAFYPSLKVKSELTSCLLTQGTPKKSV
jgi:hypothetical protein